MGSGFVDSLRELSYLLETREGTPSCVLMARRRQPRRRITTMLQLTDKAINKVKQLLEAENKQDFGLRVAVKGGGCAGFEYDLSFGEQQPKDHVLEFDGLKVFVDTLSQMYLESVKIDYVDSLQGAGFKIDNPKATGSCGCGHSFNA